MFCPCKKSTSRKNRILPSDKFPSPLLPWNAMLHYLIIQFCQVVVYGRLKTKENFQLWALKVVAVAYERWPLTIGSKCSDLTWKLLVFWKTGRWGEVAATGGSTVYTLLQISPCCLVFKVEIQKSIFLKRSNKG